MPFGHQANGLEETKRPGGEGISFALCAGWIFLFVWQGLPTSFFLSSSKLPDNQVQLG